ncbi:DUF4489 domain-containing protein [Vallitalea okinawensis]|uniref:DUF4489 domain-containing protein n=1 Tax=Vallitalea okinawensis TaxID=2078660 RepID=UPI000CFD4346|nr:DUF4489 domain-containing protein [Vallitalea okinawensis]
MIANQPFQIFCGQGGSAQFSTNDATPANIGHVTVDGIKLCRSLVKIKFSSIISLTSTDDEPEVILTFRLFRTCENEEPIELDNWQYEIFFIDDVFEVIELTKSFTFNYCDRINSSRLCEYFVEVSVDNIVRASVSIDNVQIQAIAHPTLISCGEGMSAFFQGNTTGQPLIPDPSLAELGQVMVNTSGLRKPVVEFEFSSIINLVATDGDEKASLNFQLFRACDDIEPVLVNNWLYEVYTINDQGFGNIRLSTAYSFSFCECLSGLDCCDYFIKVSVGGLQFIDSLSITDVHIAALVSESKKINKISQLECGQGRSAAFVNTDVPAINVGHVQIDTNALCKPKVSIEFSSVVSYLASQGAAQGRLRFTLFRVCDKGEAILLNNWNFELKRIDDVQEDTKFIDTFDFNFCDDPGCIGCCDYFVEVSIENLVTAIILVDNVHITALAGA